MYTRLASAFGWTWEYIDEYVTVPRLIEITEYWKQVPPLHEAFAGFFGIGRSSGGSVRPTGGVPAADENSALLQELFGAGFTLPADVIPRATPSATTETP